MSDRGFLHDIRTVPTEDGGWLAVLERVEEEDGNPRDVVEVTSVDATTIPGFDAEDAENARHGDYFETDPDLPEWLADWAGPIIDESRTSDAYREHAAEWIGEED